MKTLVVWAWAFGFAISKYLADVKNHSLSLYDKNPNLLKHISSTWSHPFLFNDSKIQNLKNIEISYELEINSYDLIILAIPWSLIKNFFATHKTLFKKWVIFLNLSKWFDDLYNTNINNVAKKMLPDHEFYYWVLSWWMIAKDVVKWTAIWADLSFTRIKEWYMIEDLFKSSQLSINHIPDSVDEIEVAWALKNVAALIYGYKKAQGLSSEELIFTLTKLTIELDSISQKLWTKWLSSCRYSWLWDLMMSCFCCSRNEQFGEELFYSWKPFYALLKKSREEYKTIEWVNTIQIIESYIEDHTMPILHDFSLHFH